MLLEFPFYDALIFELNPMDWPPEYTCATCGQRHAGLPLSFAVDFPDPYAKLSSEERDSRAICGSDQCVIDSQWFFIRGLMEIPIIGSSEPFLWGAWATVKEDVYDEIEESWEIQDREKKYGPYKGRLANALSVYPDSLNLKLEIVIQPVGARPLFFVKEDEHMIAIQQTKGISQQEALELASFLLHTQGKPGAYS